MTITKYGQLENAELEYMELIVRVSQNYLDLIFISNKSTPQQEEDREWAITEMTRRMNEVMEEDFNKPNFFSEDDAVHTIATIHNHLPEVIWEREN